MKKLWLGKTILILGVFFMSIAIKSSASDAPPNMAAGLMLQLMTFEKHLMSSNGDITIHVIGSTQLADELKKSIGSAISKCKLSKVTASDDVPTEKVSVLVISDSKIVKKAIEYTRANKIFSVTNIPRLVKKGVSLGIGMNDTGGQSLTVNIAASKAEGLDWKPAILKIAKAVK